MHNLAGKSASCGGQLTAGDGRVLQQLAACHLHIDHGVPVHLAVLAPAQEIEYAGIWMMCCVCPQLQEVVQPCRRSSKREEPWPRRLAIAGSPCPHAQLALT